MAANPSPAFITDAMWMLWQQSVLVIPGVRLGGIYADKRGYHNTVLANKEKFPGNYSITLPLDLNGGPQDKARGIDLTMSDVEMRKRTFYLRQAARHPDDNRLGAVREFYGTLNGTDVFGLIRDASGTWNPATSDLSHLWHIHMGIFTFYCASWKDLAPIISVLDGVTWEKWQEEEEEEDDMTPEQLLTFMKTQRIGWASTAMKDRMVAKGWPVDGLTTVQALTYTFEAAFTGITELGPKLNEILVAAKDDDNVNVTLPPEYLEVLTQIMNNMATEEEVRDAVADLGEGGSVQVRTDA